MAMIGAAVGGGTSLLKGQSLGDSLKGAAIGGALGGAGGLAGNAIKGASVAGSAAGTGAASGASGAGSGTIESVMGAAGPDGVFLNADYFANVMGNPIYTGSEGLLSQIGTGAGSLFDMAQAGLPSYMTPQNMIGVGQIIADTQQARPLPIAPGGGVRPGSVQGLNVNFGGAQVVPKRRMRGYA
jgi:hypothetical protein